MAFKDSSAEKKPRGIRNVLYLGLVSFFTDFSTEMILGVLPIYLVNNLGISRAILGVIEGSSELTSYVFRMISGSLSDKVRKRKIFVLIGYGLSTISKPFFVFASSWFDAFIVRTMDRVGKGVRTAPRDALIADSVSESISGKAFGIHRTIDQMGAIVGPLVAFAILQIYGYSGCFSFISYTRSYCSHNPNFLCKRSCYKKTWFINNYLWKYKRFVKRKPTLCHTYSYYWCI